MEITGQEQRHVREGIADGHGLDVGGALAARLVGDQDAVLALGKGEVLLDDLVPDRLVDTEWVAPVGGKRLTIRT